MWAKAKSASLLAISFAIALLLTAIVIESALAMEEGRTPIIFQLKLSSLSSAGDNIDQILDKLIALLRIVIQKVIHIYCMIFEAFGFHCG